MYACKYVCVRAHVCVYKDSSMGRTGLRAGTSGEGRRLAPQYGTYYGFSSTEARDAGPLRTKAHALFTSKRTQVRLSGIMIRTL